MSEPYSERDAADLLRRAALLQARRDHTGGPGLSLEEIKHAAQAAGIDPKLVEQAALGAGNDAPPSEPFLGIQTGARRTRIVPGSVSDAEWGKMVAALRRGLGGTGEVETIGGVREWRRAPYRVILEPEGETTRITASAGWRHDAVGPIAFSGFMVLMSGVVAAATFAKGNPAGLVFAAVFAAVAAGLLLVSVPRLRSKAPRIEGKLDRAMDDLAALAGADERAEMLASAPEAPEPARIDPALLDAEPPDAEPLGGPSEARRQRERE